MIDQRLLRENPALIEEGLKSNHEDIAPSMIYAYAALKMGIPFANGAPNLTVDIPALQELANKTNTPIAGKDFKTGQTLMKTILAPGLKARQIGINGWFSTNILGNRDGEVLDDPDAFDRDRGFRKTRIRAEDLKRGSSQETLEDRIERLERNRQESKEGDQHTGSVEHIETTAGVDAETGEPLSAEERKRRFRIRTGKISAEDIKRGTAIEGAEGAAKVAADTTGASALAIRKGQPDVSGSDLTPPEAEGEQVEGDKPEKNILSGLGKHVSKIADTVDSIYETLQNQFNEQKDTKEDARVQKEQKDAEKQEKDLEKGGLGKGIKDTAKTVFKPFMSIWDKFVNFLTTILVGKVVMKILEWFGNPENTDKAKSLVRFLKDWWPVLLASVMAFMPALLGTGGMIIATVILLAWAIPKIIEAVKWVMNVPNMIGNFLKGGAKDTDKLEKDSLKELDGVFTYLVATKDSLGMAKDTMAAKPMVLYESDDLVALGSEEIAIRSLLPQEIDTYDPYDGEVKVWQI